MPGSFRFEPCPNCCVTGCVYFSDDFNRADDTDLGADWTETAGDWSISSNRLSVASADAKATCNTTHPTASTKYIVSVSVTLGTDGDVARVWVNDSGQFAELERITSTCGRLRLYDGATCKGSVSVALGGFTRLVVCTEASKIHVGTGGSPMLTIPATATSSVVAIGTGACTGTVYFEDFSLSKHETDDGTCPNCGYEGCIWFTDYGCGSGNLSATDWTTTGTWEYGSSSIVSGRLLCKANGTLTLVPTHPFANCYGHCNWAIPFEWGQDLTGTVVKFYFGDDDAHLELTAVALLAPVYYWEVKLIRDGVQFGVTRRGVNFAVCWNGDTVSAYAGGSTNTGIVGHAKATITAYQPRWEVSSFPSGKTMRIANLALAKTSAQASGCADCFGSWCSSCDEGTLTTTARVVLASLTSVSPYCTCTDITIPLTATTSGCCWAGSAYGPCSSGLWTANACVTAVTGGYMLTVTVTTTIGVSATFENTVLSGSPVDCMTAFDGSVPLVSSSGTDICTLGSATCTFTSPAP